LAARSPASTPSAYAKESTAVPGAPASKAAVPASKAGTVSTAWTWTSVRRTMVVATTRRVPISQAVRAAVGAIRAGQGNVAISTSMSARIATAAAATASATTLREASGIES
jgi:hypothetical protein